MILLAIETSTDACSVGLSVHGQVLSDHRLAAQQHAGLVLPMIDSLLSEAGISPRQLDGVVYGRGPGSFTGVRIGVALTQGIALGAEIGVIGISTLQAVAQGAYRMYQDKQVAVCLDARMSEVYFAAYHVGDHGLAVAVTDEHVCAAEDVFDLLPLRSWSWVGSGVERYAANLPLANEGKDPVVRSTIWPHALDLLTLAEPYVAKGELSTPENAMPVYLRNDVALTTAEREAVRRV